jgi:hypothetical protein
MKGEVRRRWLPANGFAWVFCFELALVLFSAGTSLAAGDILAANDSLIEMVYRFNAPTVGKSDAYDTVDIKGLAKIEIPGEPQLPVQPVRILVPFGRQAARIEVVPAAKLAVPGRFDIAPAQRQFPLSYTGPIEKTAPNPAVYRQAAAYPGRNFDPPGEQRKKSYPFVQTLLYPVEYHPLSGALFYFPEIRVRVVLEPGAVTLRSRSLTSGDKSDIQNLVDNPQSIESYPGESGAEIPSLGERSLFLPAGDYKYLIITPNQFAGSDFTKLIAHKQARGTTAKIVTTEWIYANYSGLRPDGGSDNQTRIRNFITDAYNTWGTEYVLLGGAAAHIPVRYFRGVDYLDDTDVPADLYYGCLDGTFDENGDGIYGQIIDGMDGGEVDLYHEVYIGRAPVENTSEVAQFVSKTLAYDKAADNYLHVAGMLGEYMGSYQGRHDYATPTMEEIRLGASTHGHTTVGFENSDSAGYFITHHGQDGTINGFPPPLYDAEGYRWSKETLIDWINKGRGAYKGVQILNHMGHCHYEYCLKLDNEDLSKLSNTRPFFVYSHGCQAGGFDRRDCFAEEITTMKYGAVAAVMNSRYGYHAGDSTNSLSARFNRSFWHAVLGEGITELGRANAFSKEINAALVSIPYLWRYVYYEINLFGDPQLRLKVKDPALVEIDRVSTGKPYALSTALPNVSPFIDRYYPIQSISAGLKNGVLIQTAMDDKGVVEEKHLMLQFDQDAVVYVAYDKRATSLPTWLRNGWTNVANESVSTTDAGAGPMKIYKKVVSAYHDLVLGGNHQGGPNGAGSNYFIVVKPAVEIVSVSTGSPYALGQAALGARSYIDRDYTLTALSTGLKDGVLVRTANGAKNNTSPNHLVLKLHKAATVYVAYDKRANKLPTWLQTGWTLTSESVSTTDEKASAMKVYKKAVSAGTQLTLGGNHQGGDTKADSNYFLVVKM